MEIHTSTGGYQCCLGEGENRHAIKRFLRKIFLMVFPVADQSESVESWNTRGHILCESSQFDQALAAFERAIALAPDNCTAWNYKGNALCGLSQYAGALAAYDKAVALNPMYHQAWFNRGKLLTEMGAYENALESYGRAIAIEPAPHYLHAREEVWVKGQLFGDRRFV